MKQYKNLLRVVLFSVLLVSGSSSLWADALVQGVVLNGSSHQNMPGLKVELRRSGDPQKPGKLIATATSDSSGKFTFQVPKTESDSLLVASTNYQGFPYEVPAYDGGQRLSQFNVKIDPSKVRLPVFETTTSLVPLELRVSHLNVKPRAGGLSCAEYLIVDNPSQKTFLGIGKDKATVLLDLPKGAKNVRLDPQITGATLNKRPDGYSITEPIPPTLNTEGTAIIVDYGVDWASRLPWKRTVDLSREVQYPTRFFFVQRSEDDSTLQVTGNKLHSDQKVELNVNGKPINSVINSVGNPQSTQSALLPGDELNIQVTSPIDTTFWAFLAFLLLLIILIPLALWHRSTPPSTTETKADKMGEPVQEQSVYGRTSRQGVSSDDWLQAPASVQLVEQIAALDEAYAAGKILAEEYHTQRDACKRALLQFAPIEL